MKQVVGIFGIVVVVLLIMAGVGLVSTKNRAVALTERPDKEEVRLVGIPGRAADSCVGAMVTPAGRSVAC